MTTVYKGPELIWLSIKQVTAMSDSLLLLVALSYVCSVSHAMKSSHLLPLYRSQDLPLLLHISKF